MNTLMMNNNPNYIKITNYGGYMAEFTLECQKFDGTQYTLDSGAFSVGFGRTLTIQPNTQSVYLTVKIWIFGGLRVLFESPMDPQTTHCYELSKTIFDAVMNEVPCSGLGGSQGSNCCCCCCCNNNCCCNNSTMC